MSLSAMASAYADVYYSGNAGHKTGPGVSAGSPQDAGAVSPDAADYAATGGVARGGMSISQNVPEGSVAVNLLGDIPDPVVKDADPYSYDYMFHDMDLLSQRYAGRMIYREIGTSRDGRTLYEMQLGNRNARTHVLMTAAIHGREYITANLVMKQAEFLLYADAQGASFDGKRISDWLNEVCVHIVPMANPDGVSISQSGASGIRSEALRKTLEAAYQYDLSAGRSTESFADYCLHFKANAAGVDLNQNFGAAWDQASGKARQASFSGYKGPYAGSEPETAALMQLYNGGRFQAVVNYHAMGEVIYWDIAGNRLREHSRDLANNLSALTGYQMLFSAGGGGFKDYVQLSPKAAASVTLEVGRSTAPVSYAEMDTVWAQNQYVPLYTMKWAKEKGKY